MPDIMIVDLNMPGMTGMELTRELKDKGLLKEKRLIGITGYVENEQAIAQMKLLGAEKVISKPIDFECLINTIST